MDEQKFVKELLAKMTLEEKAAQMIQVPVAQNGMEESRKWAERGVGSFLHVLGDDARELQKIACSSRLGIPVIFGIDAIHGHCLNENATIFPSQLAMASSWDRESVKQVGHATATEVATDGLHWTFSPVLCLGRDSRWGRIDETFGEDKYLSGELGAAIIKGYQGDDLSDDTSILACAKHYIGYGEATGARDACDTEFTYRKMREIFLPPFKKAVQAGCATFMTAYGSIDGTPFTADRKTLHDILRDDLGFDGFLVTDWDNVNSLINNQHITDNIGEASRLAVSAGNDMIMTTIDAYDAIIEEVRSGRLDEKILDEAVGHILTVKVRLGLFDKPEKNGVPGSIGCKEHQQIALKAAEESIVLLKNDGILPLSKDKKKIAVIGPNADDIRAQYGDWTYFTHPVPGLYKEPVRPYVTLLEGIRAIAGEDAEIVFSQGCTVNGKDYYQAHSDTPDSYMNNVYKENAKDFDLSSETSMIEDAVKAAQGADVIIFAPGDNYDQHGEFKDRSRLELSGRQLELFGRLKELGTPIITVLITSKPLAVPELATESNALICAFNGGMFGGRAAAEVIYGDVVPSGRLPISFPVTTGQLPVYYNQLPGWHIGRHNDSPAEPLFAFGEGLSYTTFEYSDLKFDKDTFEASVTVTNKGSVDAAEVVQIYINDVVSSVMTACKNLAAFDRIELKAGESRTVRLIIEKEAFMIVRPDETSVIEPGEFIIMAGHSSKDSDLISISVTL